MPPVARVQHRAVHLLRQQVHGAGIGVPHDQQIGMHGVQRERRINQRLALFHGGGLHGHVHHIRPQPLACQFEAGLRAGGVLEEHVDLGAARQHIRVLGGAAVEADIAVGEIQQRRDLQRVERFDPQQVTGAKGHVVSGRLLRI